MAKDGTLIIKTKIDNSEVGKQLKEINDKIKIQQEKYKSTSDSINEVNNSLKASNSELQNMIKKYDSLSTKIKGLQAQADSPKGLSISGYNDLENYKQQKDKLGNSIDKLNSKILKEQKQHDALGVKLKEQKLQYDKLIGTKQKLEMKSFEKDSVNINKINNGLKNGIKTLSRYALALFSLSTVYSLLSSSASSWLSSNDLAARQLSANIEYMKWAIGKGLQPIIETIVNWIYKLLQMINILSTRLFGVNLFANASSKAFSSMASSASGIAKDTEKAKNNIAGFDNLDVLNDDNSSSSSGGGYGGVDPSIDFDNGTLSENTINKLTRFADKLKKIWDILEPIRKIFKWLLDFSLEHPDVILTILGGAKLFSMISKLMGVTGGSTGLLGVLGALTAIAAIGTIVIEFKILYNELKSAKKAFESVGKTADSVASKQKKANSVFREYSETLDESTENGQKFIDSMIKQGNESQKSAEELKKLRDEMSIGEIIINGTSKATEQQTKTFYAHIQATKTRIDTLLSLYNQGKLNEEQTNQLISLMSDYSQTLSEAGYTEDDLTQKFWTNEEQTKELKNEYKNVIGVLGQLNFATDDSKNKIGQLTGALAAMPSTKIIKLDADTSSARTKLNDLFSKLKMSGFSAFGSAAIGLSATLPRLARGAIVNNPGRGVNATIGEDGTEAVLPLEKNTGWMDALADKLASRIGGNRPINIKATGTLAQLIRLLKLELDNEDNRRGGSMITGGTI